MLAEIITIGDELLIGQVIDTNSAWLAQQLNGIGIKVKQITSVSDERNHILESLKEAENRADLIIITGGLGPTKDDITKNTLCEYFNCSLVFDSNTYNDIEKMFKNRGFSVTDINRKQAEVPDKCTVIPNKSGTAPGMLFYKNNKVFISMPGVPFEMKDMFSNYVSEIVKKHFKTPVIIHKTILTEGIGESFLSETISDWENNLPNYMKLAYLPSPGVVKLRITATGNNFQNLYDEVEKEKDKLLNIIPNYIYGYDDDKLEVIIGKILTDKIKTLSIAESCTGGYISHIITSVPGSSKFFKGSVIAYSNDLKINILNVESSAIELNGAVSEDVVKQMARNVKILTNSDYAIATSGIAGPEGGTKEKPVGTVWIGIATPDKTFAEKHLFGENRERTIQRSSIRALNILRKELLKN